MNAKTVLRKVGPPLLAGAVILGGLTGLAATGALATNQGPEKEQARAESESPSYVGSIRLGQEDRDAEEGKGEQSEAVEDANEAKESAALAPQAGITKDEAIDAAKAAYPGYDVKESELENENGYLVYGIEMTGSGKSLDVKVDAGNGKILSAQDDAEDGEGSED